MTRWRKVGVIDRADDSWVVWHVAVEARKANERMQRLCGAWVLPRGEVGKVSTLLYRLPILVTRGDADILDELQLDEIPLVDPQVVMENVDARRRVLRETFEAALESRKPSGRSGLVPPYLPDFATPSDIPEVSTGTPEARPTLRLARWLAQVAEQWEDMDSARKGRKYMIEALGEDTPDLPLFEAG